MKGKYTAETDEKTVREHYRALTNLLIEKNLTVTTMESATGGQIASLITDTEGASAALKGAFVTYSNEAKIVQGVPGDLIQKYSVYSKETAAAMAEACRRRYDADIGIGVTGTFGNADPANPADSVPGRVYFAIALRDRTDMYEMNLSVMPDRHHYKLAVCEAVCTKLNKTLNKGLS